MRLRVFVGLFVLIAALTAGFVTAAETQGTSSTRWALVKYDYPVRVGSATLFGTCLVVHDDARMAKGEPCTSIYRVGPDGRKELLVSFHCIPAHRDPVRVFTTAVLHVPELGTTIGRMVEYQFAGETEAHGVPADVN